jgi:hypothetical protein
MAKMEVVEEEWCVKGNFKKRGIRWDRDETGFRIRLVEEIS